MLQDVFLKAVRKQPFNAELEKVMKFYQSGFNVSLLETELKVIEEDIRETTDLNFNDIVKYRKRLHLGIKKLLLQVFCLAQLVMVCPEIKRHKWTDIQCAPSCKNVP